MAEETRSNWRELSLEVEPFDARIEKKLGELERAIEAVARRACELEVEYVTRGLEPLPRQLPTAGRPIEQKTVGMLVDELFTTCMKCWQAQEAVMGAGNAEETAAAARKAQHLNRRRNELIQAIDRSVGQEDGSPTGKTY